MKYKSLLVIVMVLITMFFTYLITSLEYKEYKKNYDPLVHSKIEEININIEMLSTIDYSNNLYDTFIILTEIKQNCLIVVELILYQENGNNKEIAIGDLLGYIYNYIDDIKTEEIIKESIAMIISELEQVNTVFLKVKRRNISEHEEYINILFEEIERSIDRYPENKILQQYSNRKIPEGYKY